MEIPLTVRESGAGTVLLSTGDHVGGNIWSG